MENTIAPTALAGAVHAHDITVHIVTHFVVVTSRLVPDLRWSTVLHVAHKSRLSIIQHVLWRALFVGVVEARGGGARPIACLLFIHHY